MQLFFSVEKTAAVMANSDETVPQCRRGVILRNRGAY